MVYNRWKLLRANEIEIQIYRFSLEAASEIFRHDFHLVHTFVTLVK